MDRLIAPNTVLAAAADVAPATGTPGFATNGNPATNTPATQWPAYQFNAFQEELMAIIAAANITPDRTKNNQVAAAITALLQSGVTVAAPDSGTVNALAITLSPAPSALVNGMHLTVLGVKAANTGAATLSVNGLGPTPIVGLWTGALQGGELYAGGVAEFVYSSTAGGFVLLSCFGGAVSMPSPLDVSQGVNLGYADARYAKLAGNAGQAFSVAAGSSSSQAVNFGQFAKTGTTIGYQKLPSGLIIQWGFVNFTVVAGTANSSPVTFPVTFPTGSIFASTNFPTSNPSVNLSSAAGIAASGMTIYVYSGTGGGVTNVPIFWFALGY